MGETEIPARYNASELLFGQVERGRGAAVAIRCEGRTVTYGELATLATEAGAGLRSLGLSRGDRVLLVLLDTPELPAVFFGAMRVGLIPVLASTALSAAEYTHLLQDSGARAVIVSEPLIPALIPAATRAPVLDQKLREGVELAHPHEDDQSLGGRGELRPVVAGAVLFDKMKPVENNVTLELVAKGSDGE